MSQDADQQRAAVQQLLSSYMSFFAQQRWDEWIALWADDGVLEFPYAPPGRRGRYVGKADILAYMKPLGGRMQLEGMDYFTVHPMLDPAMYCFEMSIRSRIVATGALIHQKYVSIIETKDGKLTLYREYWNPVASMDANGGREAWTAAFGMPEESAS